MLCLIVLLVIVGVFLWLGSVQVIGDWFFALEVSVFSALLFVGGWTRGFFLVLGSSEFVVVEFLVYLETRFHWLGRMCGLLRFGEAVIMVVLFYFVVFV